MRRFRAFLFPGLCLAIGLVACGTAASPSGNAVPIDLDADIGEHAWPGEQEATRAIAEAITRSVELRA